MRASQRGFSLMEVTVVLAIVSGLMILSYRMIEETLQTAMFSESQNDLALLSQRAMNSLQTELIQTKLIYQNDTAGNAYRTALTMPAGQSVWTTSVLPVIDTATTTFAQDPAAIRYTGNLLLFVRQLEPLSLNYNHDGNNTTPNVEFLADRYRFEYVYLRRDTSRPFSTSGMSLDLMLARSAEYADYFQLQGMGAHTGTLVSQLIARGFTRAWNPGQPIASAFYELSQATDGTFNAPVGNASIPLTRARSLLSGMHGARISGRMSYSAGFGAYPIRHPLAVFARPSVSLPGYPSGFEVKIIGPAGNRQVLTRVVLMAQYGRVFESQQATMTTATRF